MTDTTQEQVEPTVVVTHDDYIAEQQAQSKYLQGLVALQQVTMDAVRKEESFDADTFVESFDATAFIWSQVEELKTKDIPAEEKAGIILDMKRVWTLISLTTQIPVPQSMVILDKYVTEAYNLMIRANQAVNQTMDEVTSGSAEGSALLSKAAAAVKKNLHS